MMSSIQLFGCFIYAFCKSVYKFFAASNDVPTTVTCDPTPLSVLFQSSSSKSACESISTSWWNEGRLDVSECLQCAEHGVLLILTDSRSTKKHSPALNHELVQLSRAPRWRWQSNSFVYHLDRLYIIRIFTTIIKLY